MKKTIHPEYVEATVSCGCGAKFTTRSTRKTITVEICSSCHPFFTGKMKFIDTTGRVERFQKKYGKCTKINDPANSVWREKCAVFHANTMRVKDAKKASKFDHAAVG